MATRGLLQLTLLASVIWSAALGDDYHSDNYGDDEYEGDGGDGGDGRSRSAEAAKAVDPGFVQPLDFSPLFQGHAFGLTPLASQPIAAAFLKADQSQYPVLFDTAVSSSIDLLQPHVAASETVFSPENFGFKPVVSQGFLPPPAQYVQQPIRYQQNVVRAERIQAPAHSAALTHAPLQYNIQTRHDPNYRVYKPEDDLEGKDILAALKQNPAVASYFTPKASAIEIAHPQHYRREGSNDNNQQTYKSNAYLAGNPASRTRRYTDGRRKQRSRSRHSDGEESPYDYKSPYKARPKEFDSGPYSSAYTEDENKEKEDDYGYDYGADSGYSNDDYERIKKLSEAQAAEIKENPEHCKEVKKDSMTCMVCKNPKTGGNYESCSYVAEPKNNKYAYSREKKFDSKDQPDEPVDEKAKEEESKPAKLQQAASSEEVSDDDSSKTSDSTPKYKSTYRPPSPSYARYTSEPKQPYQGYKSDPSHSPKSGQYKYSPPKSAAYSAEEDEEESDEKAEAPRKAYDYKAAIPGFYTDNGPKKDVEHVLAEFKKKDRSACKKVHKNGMTCYQCIDATGLKHEECMFVSESAPKRSHLAYQELKEFTSKPATLDGKGNSEGAESQVVTTSTPPVQKSAAYVAASSEPYGSKLKRKKVAQGTDTATLAPVRSLPLTSAVGATPTYETKTNPTKVRVARSSDEKDPIAMDVVIPDETNVAPPEEFAGDASKGAFWAETQPRYSKTLGVTLPEYMLSRSELEQSFDETVAGA